MKQWVVCGALMASMVAGSPAVASNSSPEGSTVRAADTTIERPAQRQLLAEALAFDREQPLSAPVADPLASLKPGPRAKCSFNSSRGLFRLRRTDCRLV